MFNFKFVNLIIILLLEYVYCNISDKRLCANEDCSQIISEARTLLVYNAPYAGVLSFKPNEHVKIFSKSAGSNLNLWGVEINNKRGYVPKEYVRETKVITKNLSHLVNTEVVKTKNDEVPSITVEELKPDPVKKSYDVVDGTTIYYNNEDVSKVEIDKEHVTETVALPTKVAADDENKIVEDVKSEEIKNEEDNLKDKLIDDEDDDDDDLEDDEDDLEDLDDEDEDESIIEVDSGDMDNGKFIDLLLNETKQDCGGDNCKELGENESNVEIPVSEKVENDLLNVLTNIPVENVVASPDMIDARSQNDTLHEDKKLDEGFNPQIELENPAKDIEAVKDDTTSTNVVELKETASLDEEIPLSENVSSIANEDQVPPPRNVAELDPISQIKVAVNEDNSFETKEMLNTEEVVHIPYADQTTSTKTAEEVDTMKTTVNEASITSDNELSLPGALWNIINNKDLDENNELLDAKSSLPTTEENEASNIKFETEASSIFSGLVNMFSSDTSASSEENVENVLKTEGVEMKEEEEQKKKEELMKDEVLLTTGTEAKESSSLFNIMPNLAVTPNPVMDEIIDLPLTNTIQEINTQYSAIEETTVPNLINDQSSDDNTKVTNEIPLNNLESGTEETGYINDVNGTNQVQQETETENENLKNVMDDNLNEPISYLEPISIPENDVNFDVDANKVIDQNEQDGARKPEETVDSEDNVSPKLNDDVASSTCDADSSSGFCEAKNKLENFYDEFKSQTIADSINLDFSEIYNLLIVLAITAVTVVIFLWGYIFLDKNRKEAPLIAKVNNLEKSLLVANKENQLLNEKIQELDATIPDEIISNEYVENLKMELFDTETKCLSLLEEKQSLEKELENSTEVGLELNRMLTDILSSQNGSETLLANIEQLQRQLVEQQSTINTITANLNVKDTENHELQLELEICNKKVLDLQLELDKMVENLLKIEDEKEHSQSRLKADIFSLQDKLNTTSLTFTTENMRLKDEINTLTGKYRNLERNLEVKSNEYNILKDSIDVIKNSKNKAETVRNLMDVTEIKAKYEQLQEENGKLTLELQQAEESRYNMQGDLQRLTEELNEMRTKYENADKHKLEAQTKLEVLQNYFTDREAQLQREISKHESIFLEKQGEATSTTERIKFMQNELQNYKSQYESLKQELVSQEIELKSQITVLEKKAHENWVSARQAERKLEDTKQEAAQLRNRITLRERNMGDDKGQNRMQSPLEQNGDLTMSPIHMQVESPASPPLLYGTRELVTTSPPLSNLPPPFLPPPPFMPPPMPGVPPPFMPPPPSMFPGDHRPPPLGRMSSPPLNSRYSPDSRAYSPYDRNSPSPSYDEDYGSSPPLRRAYSPYNNRDDRRDYKRATGARNSIRNHKNSTNYSSGSANSNESIEKINGRHHSKV